MDYLAGIIAILCVFGIPLSAIWTYHRRKVLEMQLQLRNQGDSGIRAEIEALKQEVRSLRDTTMQYDLSFDTALQRMDHRVEGLERRIQSVNSEPLAELRNGR
jgi:hypothetical protein